MHDILPALNLGNYTDSAAEILKLYKLYKYKKIIQSNFLVDSNVVTKMRDDLGMSQKDNTSFGNREIDKKYWSAIIDRLPVNVFDTSKITGMGFIVSHGAGEISAHVDRMRPACINFYLTETTGVTNFFQSAEPTTVKISGTGEFSGKYTEAHIFPDENILKPSMVFRPNLGDMYILDVLKPHSVTNLSPNENRIVLSIDLQEGYYTEIYNLINHE